MRILLAHNFYRSSSPSGEDLVYTQERKLLERQGATVIAYERRNDDLDDTGLLRLANIALSTVWSRRTYREISRLLAREQPDIVHVHNTFPQISPSIYLACRDQGVPVVQTLHNFRTICPGALLMREQQPCEACVGTSLIPALRHRCYRGSLLATGTIAAMLTWHRLSGTYRELVSKYIALTRFAAEKFIAGGLPADRLCVRPNFLADPPAPGEGGIHALFVGRLTAEKGLHTLLSAWNPPDRLPPLKIAGDGNLRAELEQRARRERLPVEFLGLQPRSRVLELMRSAAVVIVPSECYEGFPLVVVEAYACGTPVIATDLGGLREVVVEGVTGRRFPKGDAVALREAVRAITADPDASAAMRQQARRTFEASYTSERAYERLMQIYAEILTLGVRMA